nr:MAG TPA: hypothetical protein [Caudoviricetes sp.]
MTKHKRMIHYIKLFIINIFSRGIKWREKRNINERN